MRDPIVLGVDVTEGSIRVGTPLAAVKVNEITKERTVYNLGKMYLPYVSNTDRPLNRTIRLWKPSRRAKLAPEWR
jgi:hypothetical protein